MILGANLGGWPNFGGQKKKNTEIQQLACVNLFIIILNSLFYSKEDTLIDSGAIETRFENKWALIVCNRSYCMLLIMYTAIV